MVPLSVKLLTRLRPKARRFLYKFSYPERVAEWDSMKVRPNASGLRFEPILSRKALFIHIPKCAGTSVTKAVFGGPTGSHLPLWKYEIAFTQEEMDSLWKFTFFRNPYDRVLSAYRFLMNGGFLDRDKALRDTHFAGMEFNEFVGTVLPKIEVRRNTVFRTQMEFLQSASTGKPLNFAGFCETFGTDFARVLRHLGIDESLSKTRMNTSGDVPLDYRTEYQGKSVDIVKRLYGNDLEMLGYSFDEPFAEAQRAKVARFCKECPA